MGQMQQILEASPPRCREVSSSEQAFVRGALLAAYGISTVSSVARLCQGRSRKSFLIETSSSSIVLQLMGARSAESANTEARLLRELGNANLPFQIPVVCESAEGLCAAYEGIQVLLTEFIPGCSGKPAQPDHAPSSYVLREIGASVARIHRHFELFPQNDSPGRPAEAIHAAVTALLGVVKSSHAERDLTMVSHYCSLETIANACTTALARLASVKRQGIIHGDVRFSNLVFAENGRLRGVFDFESCGPAPFALDHAFALRNLLAVESVDFKRAGKLDALQVDAYFSGVTSVMGANHSAELRESSLALFNAVALEELYYVLYTPNEVDSHQRPERRQELIAKCCGMLGQFEPWESAANPVVAAQA